MKREKNKEFTHIGNILNTVIRSCRLGTDSGMTQIWSLWNSAVGDLIAENAQPAAIKGSHLIVHATSSSWVQQLQFLKKDIIKKINTAYGKDLVEEIKFKIGPI